MRVRRAFFALACVACVRANGPPAATPIEVAPTAGAPAGGPAPAPKGACVMRAADSTLDLKVHAGDETLDIRVSDVATDSELTKDGAAIVHVRGAIELEGRVALATSADSSEPSLHTTREVVALGGLVKLGKDAEVVRPRRLDDAATGVALVGGYAVDDVPVPCDALVIEPRSVTVREQRADAEEERIWVAAHGDLLPVCTSPGGVPPCVNVHEMVFEKLRVTATSVEVRASFDDGSEIRGWAKAEHVTSSGPPTAMGYGSSGGCGCGSSFLPHLRIGTPDPREHYGEARLRAGSKIYALPELRAPWANVAEEVKVEIAMNAADEYARITVLPGISTSIGCNCPGMDDRAYVKREAVVPIR